MIAADRFALVAFHTEWLAQLLQLPDGTVVEHVWCDPTSSPGMVHFRLRGVGPLLRPGMAIPSIHAQFNEKDWVQVPRAKWIGLPGAAEADVEPGALCFRPLQPI